MKNAIGVQSNKYKSRDRDSRNKKVSGASYSSAHADPMQAIPNYNVNKTTATGLVDINDPSRNLITNTSLEYKTNKEAMMKNVKKQNQKLL